AYARALAIFQQLMVDFPNEARFRKEWDGAIVRISLQASALASAGDKLRTIDRKYTEALQIYETVIAIYEKCGPALGPVRRMSTEANARLGRANLLWELGRVAEIERECTAALPIVVQLMNDFPKNVYMAGWATRQAELLILRGLCRADAGKNEQAAGDL